MNRRTGMRYVSQVFLILVALVVTTGPARAGDPVLALLDPYFRIQSQLTSDTTDGIKDDAAMIAKGAQELGDAGKSIAKAAAALGDSSSLADARAAFAKLSDAVIAYADNAKTNVGTDVHTMYCPMAKKSWMQKGEKVRNPYLGKSMSDCGEKKPKAS
jgi:hypothetical protein